jgi:hypothetical protein
LTAAVRSSALRAVGAVLVVFLPLVAGCSGDDDGVGAPEGAFLEAPAGTGDAVLEQAAVVVRDRLARMGLPDADVTVVEGGLEVVSRADPFQLEASARRAPTTIAPVTGVELGSCDGPGRRSIGPGERCYQLAPAATDVSMVAEANARRSQVGGWEVALAVDPAGYAALDAALSQPASSFAVVADDVVALEFATSGPPGQRSTIGPGLSEEQARRAAAALRVSDALPVPLEAPALPPARAVQVDEDFWTAALGVEVCGRWLPNAPPFGADTGIHSHGDGLVYLHPFSDDDAGDRATLGRFLQRGGWNATTEQLLVWDDTVHRRGDRCPSGAPGNVSWWVDGERQDGDPGEHRPLDNEVIVLAFGDDRDPGPPPQLRSLPLPQLVAG